MLNMVVGCLGMYIEIVEIVVIICVLLYGFLVFCRFFGMGVLYWLVDVDICVWEFVLCVCVGMVCLCVLFFLEEL